ncbi:MAG TPA: YraN family protein [Acidimicrobiales bacterium]|nr:YraN family protein [Acidimicrobiales bacterium]
MGLGNQALGAYGENRVAAWYAAHGYEILDRNWRCPAGELDLVCRSGATLVFCEVKTRTTSAFGLPAEAVNRTKQQRLRRLALAWLEAGHDRPAGATLRFDVACVLGGKVEIIEAAF